MWKIGGFMRNINNKYTVQKAVESEEFLNSYLVKDEEDKKKYIICILKKDFIYEKSRTYLLNKFNTIKNLNFDNMFKLIRIEIITSIDGIKLDKPKYGYILEGYDYKINTEEFIRRCTVEEKLNIFMEVCASINTLNINGYIFDKINLNDIKIIDVPNKNIRIKLKNILQNELRKLNLYSSSMNFLLFPYNVDNRDEFSSELNNIDVIIDLFNKMFDKEDLLTEILEIGEISRFFSYIKTSNKICTATYFIKYINNRVNKNYKIFIGSNVEKLKLNLDIIGQEEELNIVEKKFNNVVDNKEKYSIICFNGDNGTGKTRLLNEIEYIISKKYCSEVLYIKNLEDYNMPKEEICKHLINFIYNRLDKSLREKYGYYIRKFITIFIQRDYDISEDEKFQLVNRITKCISEYAAKKQIVILIDNLEEKHDIIKFFIKYITLYEKSIDNIMIVFTINSSYCDEEFLSFLKHLKILEEYEEYTINYFNQYNTTKMVKNILNYSKAIDKLSMDIFSKALGNPQYIISIIEELYNKKSIYFDINLGEWKINDECINVLIPKKIDIKINSMISSLKKSEIDVLEQLSIFLTSLPESIILKYVITDEIGITAYNKLKTKHFLADKISDKGVLVGFTNDLLKNILYSKLSKEKKFKMHTRASEFLEDEIYEDDSYIEEFIYNLEKIGKEEKIYFYTEKCAEAEFSYGNTLKSIEYYKKALNYSDNRNKCRLAISIAKLYESTSDHENSLKYFRLANEYSFKLNEKELQIYTNIEIIIIKINSSSEICNQNILLLLQNIREQLDNIDYPKGEIYYYYAIMLKERLEGKYEKVLEYGNRALSILKDFKRKDDIYGWILNVIIGQYRISGRYSEAKKLTLKAIKVFENNRNMNGYLFSKNVYIELLKEDGAPIEKIIDNLIQISRLSNRNKLYKREIFSLINIAICYLDIDNYVEAEKYILRTLDRQKEESVEFYSVMIYNAFCLLQIRLGNIKLAVKYYTLSNLFSNNYDNSEENCIDNKITSYYYNLLFYNYKGAYNIIKGIYSAISNKNDYKSKYMICNYYQMILCECKNENEAKSIYYILENKIEELDDKNKQTEIKIKTLRLLFKLGYVDFANKIFYELKEFPKNHNIEAYYIYLELHFKGKVYYNYLINKALRVCNLSIDNEIKTDLYATIGEKYSELECHSLAINYYYESISLHKEIFCELPVKERLMYVNRSDFLKVYKLLVVCFNKKLKIRMNFKSFDYIKNEDDLNDLLNEIHLTRLLGNTSIYNLAQSLYEKLYYNDLNDIYTVFSRFNEDTVNNLENIIKYIAKITLSDKAVLFIENENGESEAICNYRVTNIDRIKSYFSSKIESQDNVLIISKDNIYFDNSRTKILNNNVKSYMYVKIRNKETYLNGNNKINAKLILIANNALNNINDNTKKIVEKFLPFIKFMLEKYNLTINSMLDKLTGAYNRKYFEQALIILLENARIFNETFGIIMFDIDNFKGVNDKYGHQAGDEVLVKIVAVVKNSISKNDIVGRYGGEEFIVLIPNADKEKVINIAEKIRSNVEENKVLGEKREVTISVGVTIGGEEILNSDEIIERADQALYNSKNTGKNKITFWNKSCRESSENTDANGMLFMDISRDYKLSLVISDLMNLMKYKLSKEEKIHQFSLKIIQTIKCESIGVFLIENNKIINTFITKENGKLTSDSNCFNLKFIHNVIEKEKSIYSIDWENEKKCDKYGIPTWKSICLVPIISNGKVIAVLYLYDSINNKEFNNNDCNLINSIGQLSIPIFL
ncbi:MAG: diguanylate cyclase [Clostridium butyricum]|nr:diguanylate cyclase [Clostridium butyricum]